MGNCNACGEPMPPGEEMFMFHGYSGPCPKPPQAPFTETQTAQHERRLYALDKHAFNHEGRIEALEKKIAALEARTASLKNYGGL